MMLSNDSIHCGSHRIRNRNIDTVYKDENTNNFERKTNDNSNKCGALTL